MYNDVDEAKSVAKQGYLQLRTEHYESNFTCKVSRVSIAQVLKDMSKKN